MNHYIIYCITSDNFFRTKHKYPSKEAVEVAFSIEKVGNWGFVIERADDDR